MEEMHRQGVGGDVELPALLEPPCVHLEALQPLCIFFIYY